MFFIKGLIIIPTCPSVGINLTQSYCSPPCENKKNLCVE